jgi:putative Mn2+ efflux pump MntP
MPWSDLLGLAVSLSMDALAVALAAGLGSNHARTRHPLRLGFCFGACQSLTVMMGWLVGMTLRRYLPLAGGAAWLAFVLLTLLGGRMVFEAFRERDRLEVARDPSSGWRLLVLSAATSADGLVAGVPLAALGITIWRPAAVIGTVVAALTLAGVFLAGHVGKAWGRRAGIAGGFGLCAVGTKILVVHVLAR